MTTAPSPRNHMFPSLQGDGRTALHWASENGHRMVCELLQAAGADGTAEDLQFVTPQDLSVQAGVDFIIVSDSNPITLKDLQDARIRVDPSEFPVRLPSPTPCSYHRTGRAERQSFIVFHASDGLSSVLNL